MGVEIGFDGYLRSLVSAYQQWWRLYTLTDATGRESQRVEREQLMLRRSLKRFQRLPFQVRLLQSLDI